MEFNVPFTHLNKLSWHFKTVHMNCIWGFRSLHYTNVHFIMIRPHRSITYVDAAYCYRQSSVVCLSVGHSICQWALLKPFKNGWTDRDAVLVMDSGEPKEEQVQSYSPGVANVPSWKGTLVPPGEYDWTVRLRRRCSLMPNYFDHLLLLLSSSGLLLLWIFYKLNSSKTSKSRRRHYALVFIRFLLLSCTSATVSNYLNENFRQYWCKICDSIIIDK